MYALLKGSPLAYPGQAPGFDPSHPAAQGMAAGLGISCIASGANFINLLNGKPFSVGSAPTASNQQIGPSALFNSVAYCDIGSQSTKSISAITMAAIFQLVTVQSTNAQIAVAFPSTPYAYLGLNAGKIGSYLSGQIVSTITPSAGIPYFAAMSAEAGGTVNFLLLNLLTGQVLTYSTTTSSGSWSSSATIYVGAATSPNSQQLLGYLAAAMYSPTFLSIYQLLAWAADPWPFWYPRGVVGSLDWLTAPAAPTFLAAWALNRNRINDGVAT